MTMRKNNPMPETRVGYCVSCQTDPVMLYLTPVEYRYRCANCYFKEVGSDHPLAPPRAESIRAPESSERLRHLSLLSHWKNQADNDLLVVQLDDGFASEVFPRGLPVKDVIDRLRKLADVLDVTTKDRSMMNTLTVSNEMKGNG